MDSSCSTGFPRRTSVSRQNSKQERCASRDEQQEAYTVRVQLLIVDRARHPVLGCVACAQAKLRARAVDPGAGYESTRVAQYMSDYITRGKAQRLCTVQNNGFTVNGNSCFVFVLINFSVDLFYNSVCCLASEHA